MPAAKPRSFDRPAAVVGLILVAVAAVLAFDASRMSKVALYGIGPTAMPNVLAVFFALLGFAHFVAAFRGGLPEPEAADWKAFGWVGGALVALIAVIGLGGGFIIGSTLLFAMTARAFGRRAFAVDLAIGFAIALLVFLLFNNLLSLTLPQGPLERLL
ncbi:tripartite tricarboxylate transporter TctB family protein [Aureimonas leprariae]|uniref:Tripartite tricarboxylate transporter TctB family protein n=1 Tax=Plantimonas leprariae TaxID=2615207 RepID=A0A7V7PLD0_9HYPH|nr:tripartite tricarboxylate transporter TctB family protein [Aureimonas leprariae]KAB0676875.1 tripartite tricarboxylate transporter TctB family protein [Aureimonas leprariae]